MRYKNLHLAEHKGKVFFFMNIQEKTPFAIKIKTRGEGK